MLKMAPLSSWYEVLFIIICCCCFYNHCQFHTFTKVLANAWLNRTMNSHCFGKVHFVMLVFPRVYFSFHPHWDYCAHFLSYLLLKCFSSFMVVTQPKFQTSLGMQMNLGFSAVYPRTTLCKCCRWLKTFIMMRILTLPPLSLSQGHHESSWENSLSVKISSVKILLALYC